MLSRGQVNLRGLGGQHRARPGDEGATECVREGGAGCVEWGSGGQRRKDTQEKGRHGRGESGGRRGRQLGWHARDAGMRVTGGKEWGGIGGEEREAKEGSTERMQDHWQLKGVV